MGPMNRSSVGPLFVAGSIVFAPGGAGVKPASTASGTAGGGNATGIGGFGGSMTMAMPCVGQCMDFPPTPVLVGSAPANAATIFGGAGTGSPGGPCLIEPQDNTLFPYNWLRPRFRFTGGAGLYEIRLHASKQANDRVVYTTETTWTMDKSYWSLLSVHTRDIPIEVTVRSAPPGGATVQLGSHIAFTVAPVSANGKL